MVYDKAMARRKRNSTASMVHLAALDVHPRVMIVHASDAVKQPETTSGDGQGANLVLLRRGATPEALVARWTGWRSKLVRQALNQNRTQRTPSHNDLHNI